MNTPTPDAVVIATGSLLHLKEVRKSLERAGIDARVFSPPGQNCNT